MLAPLIIALAVSTAPASGVRWEVGRALMPDLAERATASFPTRPGQDPGIEIVARSVEDARIELLLRPTGGAGVDDVLARRTFAPGDPQAWVFLRVTLDRHLSHERSDLPTSLESPAAPGGARPTTGLEAPERSTGGLWARASGRLTMDGESAESGLELGAGLRGSRWSLGVDLGFDERELTPSSTVLQVPLTVRGGYALFDPLEVGLSVRGELLAGDPGVAVGLHAGAWASVRFPVFERESGAFFVGLLVEPQVALLRPRLTDTLLETWTEAPARLAGTAYVEWMWW